MAFANTVPKRIEANFIPWLDLLFRKGISCWDVYVNAAVGGNCHESCKNGLERNGLGMGRNLNAHRKLVPNFGW